jgi:hypothetical protein
VAEPCARSFTLLTLAGSKSEGSGTDSIRARRREPVARGRTMKNPAVDLSAAGPSLLRPSECGFVGHSAPQGRKRPNYSLLPYSDRIQLGCAFLMRVDTSDCSFAYVATTAFRNSGAQTFQSRSRVQSRGGHSRWSPPSTSEAASPISRYSAAAAETGATAAVSLNGRPLVGAYATRPVVPERLLRLC